MNNAIKSLSLVLLIVLGGTATAKPSRELTPIAPVKFITEQFEQFSLVSIGEQHDSQDLHELYISLVKNERFQNVVDDIVLEYGNSLYQDLLDRYVSGEDVPFSEVQKVWRNIFVSQALQYGVDAFADLIRTVREENKGLPKDKKLRVLAGGLPFDWGQPDLKNQFNRFSKNSPRDPHYANVVLDEVLKKNRKALLISGTVHMKRTSTIPSMIESEYPGSLYAILATAKFGGVNRDIASSIGERTERPVALRLQHSWLGTVDASEVSRTTGNIMMKALVNEAPKNNDIIVTMDENDKEIVEHVISGQRVVVYADAKVINTPVMPAGPFGPVMGAGLPPGHYRRDVPDAGRTLSEIADAMILVDETRKRKIADIVWEDDGFWDELDRRNQEIYSRPIDPSVRRTRGASAHHD